MKLNIQKERRYFILGSFGILLIVFLGIYSAYLNYKGEKDDRFCLKNSDDLKVVDFLFDVTDRPSKNQKRVIENRLEEKLSSLPQGTLVRIFSISSDIGGLSNVEFEMCKPAMVSETSELTGNKLLSERNYRIKFKAPLSYTLQSILIRKTQELSPIIEALHDYSKKVHPVTTSHEIIIFSDLLQNTDDYSVYSENKRLTSYPYDVDLNQADVHFYVMERKGNMRKRQNRQFIEDWSKIVGKNVMSLTFEKVRS